MEGWKCFRDGNAGFISQVGLEVYPFKYKNFEMEDGILYPIPFAEWKVYEGEKLITKIEADISSWKNLNSKTGKLTDFYYPKQYF